jgi:glycine dehydrogenase subunit 2
MELKKNTGVRKFHQAKWCEPVIFELSQKNERGILVPEIEKEIETAVGDGLSELPENMKRKIAPALPELGQMQVLKHYLRLSQEKDREPAR